ncbi:MAG TPA: PQQ-binding-like beta-propeller repeat protein [Solirubrobacterales bacterium]|nr:PQQ-binding-like beta-propeller repeat protein [Solirubrobacterales bacterium]
MKEKDLGLKFWAAVAVSAIGMGVAIAFVAGFFLGHFTGHHHTTTVAAGTATSTEEASSEEGEATTAANGIALAPAFTSDELNEEAGDNWITNGGNLTNDRFSTLDEINTENVSELKGDYVTKIGKEASAAKFSAEGQALEYEGTIYIADGGDNVYAIDASSGEITWTYEPHLPPDPLGEVICCGWDNRGVAIGDGMVFVSQLNGDQVALDQETGKVKWSTPVVEPGSGYSITSAPLYYNGTVYVGGSGGEYGIRGRLTAIDATTGKIKWRSYTIPGPGEPEHDTWPADNDAWKHGGGGIWNTPTVDPKTETLFFATSNAAPDWNGAEREGDNKWAASIVAMDAKTGKIKWGYQIVHHDLWDFDCPSPTVLMEGEMNGERVEAVGEPCKTGWAYVLDRNTGKPVYPIPEVKVPQDPTQKTSPTQPEPTMEPFSPIQTSQESVKKVEESLAGETPTPKVVGTKIFHPMSTDPTTIYLTPNSANGGNNWPPSSYDPEKNMYFVCSLEGAMGVIAETNHTQYKAGETFTGGEFGPTTGFAAPGLLTAYDMSTGKIAWQDKFPESCYSGAVTTAGGLVFVGQNNGELQAFDTENGEKLWSFQTGAGANTTVTPFEDEGEEKIAIYAGGNSLAATPHGENFWVFSLNGTMGPEKGTEKESEGTLHAGEEEKGEEGETPTEEGREEKEEEEGGETAGAGGPNAEAGKEVFAENCSTCHGATGHGGNGGPDLRTMPLAKTQAGAEKQVTNGGGGMPPFKGTLSEEEIKNVAAFVVEDIVGGK